MIMKVQEMFREKVKDDYVEDYLSPQAVAVFKCYSGAKENGTSAPFSNNAIFIHTGQSRKYAQ